jgi:hypothetical protein
MRSTPPFRNAHAGATWEISLGLQEPADVLGAKPRQLVAVILCLAVLDPMDEHVGVGPPVRGARPPFLAVGADEAYYDRDSAHRPLRMFGGCSTLSTGLATLLVANGCSDDGKGGRRRWNLGRRCSRSPGERCGRGQIWESDHRPSIPGEMPEACPQTGRLQETSM